MYISGKYYVSFEFHSCIGLSYNRGIVKRDNFEVRGNIITITVVVGDEAERRPGDLQFGEVGVESEVAPGIAN